MTIWVKKKKIAKGPEFWHEGFISPEKHYSEVFFAGLLFVFEEITFAKRAHRLEKPSVFCIRNISKTN